MTAICRADGEPAKDSEMGCHFLDLSCTTAPLPSRHALLLLLDASLMLDYW